MGGAAAGAAGKAVAKPLAKVGEAIKVVGSEVAAGFSEATNKVPAKPVKTTANAPDAGRIASIVKSVKPHTIEEVNEVASMLSEELGRKVSTTEVWAALYKKPSEIEDHYRKRSVYDENPEEFVQKRNKRLRLRLLPRLSKRLRLPPRLRLRRRRQPRKRRRLSLSLSISLMLEKISLGRTPCRP